MVSDVNRMWEHTTKSKRKKNKENECHRGDTKRYIPLMTQYRNVDIAGKTPKAWSRRAHEFSEQEVFACLAYVDL